MTYYDKISMYLKDHSLLNWDYYKCHYQKSIKELFDYPQQFIENTFINAQKTNLINASDQTSYYISNARAAHSISAFFLGFMLAENLVEKENFCSFAHNNNLRFCFSYIWTLTSLYHDFGYSFEYNNSLHKEICEDSSTALTKGKYDDQYNKYGLKKLMDKLDILHSIYFNRMHSCNSMRKTNLNTPKSYINQYIDCHMQDFICNGIRVHIPMRSKSLISNYLDYRLFGRNSHCCIDHGIAGGISFYDKLIKNYIELYKKEKEYNPKINIAEFITNNNKDTKLRVGIDQTISFAYIADCVINHNIWKASDNNEEIYKTFKLNKLIGKKFEKINFNKNPLLFILVMSDTLEPYKNFHCNYYKHGIDKYQYSSENPLKIFKEFDISVKSGKIIYSVPKLYFDDCRRKLDDMKKWIDIDYNEEDENFIVKIL